MLTACKPLHITIEYLLFCILSRVMKVQNILNKSISVLQDARKWVYKLKFSDRTKQEKQYVRTQLVVDRMLVCLDVHNSK